MRLDGKTVVITGVAGGIGRETALLCANEGADIVGGDIDADRGKAVIEAVRETGGSARFHQLDVSEYDAVEHFLNAADEAFDGIDVLVNNAGISRSASIEETTPELRDRLVAVNLIGVWNGCKVGASLLKEQGGGSIVNVSSVTGLLGLSNFSTYALTKAGVVNLTYSLAAELGPHNIRVNTVCPGRVETPMLESVLEDADDAETLRKRAESEHALNRMGQPDEIAHCIAFLASEDASYVTGAALVADGGARFRTPIL